MTCLLYGQPNRDPRIILDPPFVDQFRKIRKSLGGGFEPPPGRIVFNELVTDEPTYDAGSILAIVVSIPVVVPVVVPGVVSISVIVPIPVSVVLSVVVPIPVIVAVAAVIFR